MTHLLVWRWVEKKLKISALSVWSQEQRTWNSILPSVAGGSRLLGALPGPEGSMAPV